MLLAEARLTGNPNEALIKSLIRTYKLLGAAAKGQLPSGKGEFSSHGLAAYGGLTADVAGWGLPLRASCPPAKVGWAVWLGPAANGQAKVGCAVPAVLF